MNTLLKNHFDVQTGMYFSKSYNAFDWTILTSDIIEDGYWNYAILPADDSAIKNLSRIEEVFKGLHRSSSIYVINENNRKNCVGVLINSGYEKISEESFMTYAGNGLKIELPNGISIVRATNVREKNDFINVFTSAYGGEKTLDQPYGELDETYMNALIRSFDNEENFYHYVCYANGIPVSIATLCFCDRIGGIYNVGTNPSNRGNGYGTWVTKACIEKWNEMRGTTLLLQTETGSAVEQWYYSLGFKLEFYGSTYCKTI